MSSAQNHLEVSSVGIRMCCMHDLVAGTVTCGTLGWERIISLRPVVASHTRNSS